MSPVQYCYFRDRQPSIKELRMLHLESHQMAWAVKPPTTIGAPLKRAVRDSWVTLWEVCVVWRRPCGETVTQIFKKNIRCFSYPRSSSSRDTSTVRSPGFCLISMHFWCLAAVSSQCGLSPLVCNDKPPDSHLLAWGINGLQSIFFSSTRKCSEGDSSGFFWFLG